MAPLNPYAAEFFPSWMYESPCTYEDGNMVTEEELAELEVVDEWISMLAEDDVLAELASYGIIIDE
eukprot:CAMPEP_0117666668 /NCGR_PEP_ID=MMETSP0804-20121206/10511_1 /TAXON_ID=1074897 /ORGANISM="Tetraselmis astigmatica, Strain CCMP880" /LENGTH=65 /DNA_ID=CAMNT_0005474253 /DNA_START=622 /DNA_END=819 /DNA_ORIENTATION=-